ncbi:MAG: antibiotic biosynthesis monooxygenase [Propionibacteriaceae bacterium]|nr:antibiotic biosynthesis monooxygenase [Propionibacteriaceae bacterium]
MSIKVVADNFIKPDAIDEFVDVVKELIAQTHANDQGCIAYGLFRDKADATHLTVIEEWESQEALDAHIASEHFQRLFPSFAPASQPDKPGLITVYEPVA